MGGLKIADVSATPQGIPQRNVEALKAFLAAKREQEVIARPIFTKRQERLLKTLPEEKRVRLEKFIRSIPKTRFFRPDGKPNWEWLEVHHGRTWVEAQQEAFDATKDEDRDVAKFEAGYAAEKAATNKGRSKAVHEAKLAALSATEAVLNSFVLLDNEFSDVRNAILTDIALMAVMIAVSDIDFPDKEKHMAHAKARWEVWRKGYGLWADVDGRLYVYCKCEDPTR